MMRKKVMAELKEMGFKIYPDLKNGHDHELIFYKDCPLVVGFVGEHIELVDNAQNVMPKVIYDEFRRLCAKANGKLFMSKAVISF